MVAKVPLNVKNQWEINANIFNEFEVRKTGVDIVDEGKY